MKLRDGSILISLGVVAFLWLANRPKPPEGYHWDFRRAAYVRELPDGSVEIYREPDAWRSGP